MVDQNIKGKEMKKLKMLHKLQRAQQLTLRGATGESYNLVNEVIIDILEERRMKNWRQEQHENKVFGKPEKEVVKSCGGIPAGFIPNE